MGGNLSILQPPTFRHAAAVVAPKDNLLVTFKGDQAHRCAWHVPEVCSQPACLSADHACMHARRVEEFHSASMRVSVTLEQYLVPAELYWATVEFQAKRLRY